jgi:hypothetical protein
MSGVYLRIPLRVKNDFANYLCYEPRNLAFTSSFHPYQIVLSPVPEFMKCNFHEL